MPLNDGAKNAMLNALGALIGYISLHTADPGTTGTSEETGGSPAYARKAATWNSAATHSMTSSNQQVFDVPASTVAWIGFFSTLTTGTFYGSADVTDEVFAGQGTYTVTQITISVN
jgi:hypothetical protein